METDSQREESLSQLCLEAHQEFQNGKYRQALAIYTDIKSKLDKDELTDNWIIIKQMGLCEYRLNHKKKAYQIWMSLEQNPIELFVFVTEKIQNESTLLLPELMELFPNFRFLFYIAADRLLKVERLGLLKNQIENCPHPFDQYFLGGIQSLFFTTKEDSTNYISTWRANLSDMIKYTSEGFETQRDLMELCFATLYHFHASYLDDFTLTDSQNWSGVVRKIYPSMNYTVSHDVKDSVKGIGDKIKIGFVNCFANRLHSVTRDRAGIIINMDPNVFDKHLIYLQEDTQQFPLVNQLMEAIPQSNHHKIRGEQFLFQPESILQNLGECQFDVIVFCELGMNPISYLLAHARLAPIQITTWGHSMSSGISTIDYYISSRLFEPESNQEYYSEKLILMDSLSTYYPTITPPDNNEADCVDIHKSLQIPEDAFIIGCIQSYFKLQSDWFDTVREILSRGDKKFYLLLQIPKSGDTHGGSFFEKEYNKRLQTLLGEDISQVRFLETMDYRTYLQVLSQCDLMIDPFPFGGCNTTLESFALGKVVITKMNRLLPGRFSLGFYRKIGINENTPDSPVCRDNDSYVERCCELLVNGDKRQTLEKIIQNNSGSLFLEQDSIKEWEGVITRLVRERIPSNNINVEIEKLPSVQSSNENDEDEEDDEEEDDEEDKVEDDVSEEISVLKKSVDSLQEQLETERKLYKKKLKQFETGNNKNTNKKNTCDVSCQTIDDDDVKNLRDRIKHYKKILKDHKLLKDSR